MGEEMKFTRETLAVINSLMENSNEMIFTKNTEGIYTLASDSYAKFLGFESRNDVIGYDDFFLMKSEEAAQICKKNDFLVISKDCVLRDLDEEWKHTIFWANRTLATSKFPIHDEEGNVIGILGICKDSTQENRVKKAAEQYKNAYDNALGAREAKTEFLMRMSREIRNPLNAIMGLTTLALEEQADSGKIAECLKQINVSGKYLVGLVNDILDMEKIESGAVELNACDFDFTTFLENIYAMMRAAASEKNQTFVINSDDVKHRMIIGDATRIQQIFVNLISNSIRYSPLEGTINVDVKEKSLEDGVVTYDISFKDNGIGIPDAYMQHLFEPLSKLVEINEQVATDVGVRLAITRNLVKMMDGDISVETNEGVGTTFFVTLSFPLSNAYGDDGMGLKEDDNADFSGCRALLAEDNDLSAEISKELLEITGIEVVRVENGKEAVEIFEGSPENHFDVVFMDIQMPLMDGYEATRKIRELERNDSKCVPIIAMTASALAQDIYASKKAGMTEHMAKPVDFDIMCATMNKYIKAKK